MSSWIANGWDEAPVALSGKWYEGPQTVVFRARGVWNIVPDQMRQFRSEHRHHQAVQKSGCDNEKREMAKRPHSDEVRETCATGSGASVVQRHAESRIARSAQIGSSG